MVRTQSGGLQLADENSRLRSGPCASLPVVPRRAKRGGRASRLTVPTISIAAITRLSETRLTRAIKPCIQCDVRHTRCIPNPHDCRWACSTCISSRQECSRSENMKREAARRTLVQHLIPCHESGLRVYIGSATLRQSSSSHEMAYRNAVSLENLFLEPSGKFIAPLIVLVHGASDDVKWNAFQMAFRIAFNPTYSLEACCLRYMLRTWAIYICDGFRVSSTQKFDKEHELPRNYGEVHAKAAQGNLMGLVNAWISLATRTDRFCRFALNLSLFIGLEVGIPQDYPRTIATNIEIMFNELQNPARGQSLDYKKTIYSIESWRHLTTTSQ